MNKIKIFFTILISFLVLGCSAGLDDSRSDDSGYGSLTITQGSDRSIDTSLITKAVVTISGSGMTDLTQEITISDGKGTATIDRVKAGKNRVITVQAYNDSTKLNGVTLRSVTDISAGTNNSAEVSWKTTAEGNVFYNILNGENSVNLENVLKSVIENAIPSDVSHACLVDAASIAKDYGTDGSGLKSSSNYKLTATTVSFKAVNASGYTVAVGDPLSSVKSVSADGTITIENVAPGSWPFYVTDTESKTTKKTIRTTSGSDCNAGTVGDVLFGKFYIFVKADSAPKLWAYDKVNGNTGCAYSEKLGETWTGTAMTAATSDIMNDPAGWYYKDFSSSAITPSTSGEIYIHLNGGSAVNTKVAGGTTFWYDNGTTYLSDPTTPVSTDPEITVKYSAGLVTITSNVDVTSAELMVTAGTKSSKVTSFTSKTATVDVSSWGLAEGSTVNVSGTINDCDVEGSVKVSSFSGVKIYVSASSAPTIWAWTSKVKNITNAAAWPGETMTAATDLNYNAGWFVITTTLDNTNTDAISIILNSGSDIATTKTATFWYDAAGINGAAGTYFDADPTKKPDPVKPTLTISPASGKEIGTASSIKVTADFGYDTPAAATVTINGTTKTLSEGTNSFAVKDFATEAGKTITVSGTVTNSVGTATVSATYTTKILKEDPFTWDNVNAYFVLTDRFYNGDSSNDHSYYRKNGLDGDTNVATFHGGDLAGLTAKLDYFDKLGVNAIWITAPYEQIHGWVGGKNGAFPHYAFHGYYTLDWSSMDQNMGTVEELRTFVNACHSKGIRVIMDVVMNHVGYNNTQDMVTFKYGYTEHTDNGWLAATDGLWVANDTVKWDNSYWDSTWFGPWIRSFGYDSGSEYGGSCGGLPDVKTELKESVGMAPVLTTKWGQDTADYKKSYYNPSVANADWNGYSGDYRKDRDLAPADYQVIYLSAWVREVGIDGFRCDTAKHVEPERWGQLKVACQAALEAWREDSSKSKLYNGTDTGAADWDESFWMTGECFGWTSTSGQSGDYYDTGKFDSMINFSFNGSAGDGTSSSYPSESTWSSYININKNADSDGNGNRNNVLTYISSHDTKLCRASDQNAVGTMLQLTPGGIQIYYGDETSRPRAYTGCGDTDMMTRGDFNWDAATGACATHWGKVGNFRKYNPAVGAGTGSATLRTYSGAAGDNKVAISVNGTSIDVSSLWSDGTTVYNWYDGKSASVSGGKVTFAGGSADQPVLVSDKNPADCGVSF